MPRIVLYQPQIPPNTGNVARTCAATGTELHLIEPLGFQIDDRQLRRAGLDYWPLVDLERHRQWQAFLNHRSSRGGRLISLSSHAEIPYCDWNFEADDWLLFGRESDGLPSTVQGVTDAKLVIPMVHAAGLGQPGVRSLNLSVAVGVVLFEALRQLDLLTLPGSPASTGIGAGR
ncbi:MAG: tRNA (cytidine(34)-2'-O)-methyltransferase [Synechococcus sp.]|nr:tRNA (cytidine(34)-2'-O)-methyltransferase [Synechococcus sp.]